LLNESPIIKTNNLTKIFNRKIFALDKVNFEVFKGITALVGANGAGKSTLIKLLLGLLKPTKGTAEVFGRDAWTDSTIIKQKIGFVHENQYFPTHLTAQRYLDIIKLFHEDYNSHNISKMLQLPLKREIEGFSAGMIKKLGLLQAFMFKPQLIIMDEPTSNLDPLAREDILNLILHLYNKYQINFIISSHIFPELEQIANNILVLNLGKVKFQGTFNNFIEKYHSNHFEIYSNTPFQWKNTLEGLDFTRETKMLCNKVFFTSKYEISSSEVIELCSTANKDQSPLHFDLFRRKINYKKLFEQEYD
jgi:ABC-2 type transport system ATP-binding protein